jgi:hypothetical protein
MGISRDIKNGYMDGYMSNSPGQPEEDTYTEPANTEPAEADEDAAAQYPEPSQEQPSNAQSQKYIPRKEKKNYQIPGPSDESKRIQAKKDLNHTMYNSGVNHAHRTRQMNKLELGREFRPPSAVYEDTKNEVREKFNDQKVYPRRG